MIRPIRPTDLVALAYFNRKANPNEAKTRANLQRKHGEPLPIRDFLEQWLSLEENRHSWIYIENRRVMGLISVRNKAGSSLWDIDRLYLAAEAEGEICTQLLNYLTAVGGEIGMHRVFLRLAEDSHLLEHARQAGFYQYQYESLYRWNGHNRPSANAELVLKTKGRRDDHGIFQLYNSSVPAVVRQVQAMTFQEWRELRDKNQDMRDRQEFILQENGVIVGWLQILTNHRIGQFDLLIRPGHEQAIEGMASFALSRLSKKSSVYSLIPEYQVQACRMLEEYGFISVGRFCSMVKQLAVHVRQPRLVPVRA